MVQCLACHLCCRPAARPCLPHGGRHGMSKLQPKMPLCSCAPPAAAEFYHRQDFILDKRQLDQLIG